MTSYTVTKEDSEGELDPLWERLMKAWDGKAGYVNFGAHQYRVLHPSDGVVNFIRQNGFDDMYGSNSGSIS